MGVLTTSISKPNQLNTIESMKTEFKDICLKYGIVEKPLIYRGRDKPLKYYAPCETCRKLVFGVTETDITHHLIQHFQTEILSLSIEETYCKQCDKSSQWPYLLARHLGVMHNMLAKFVTGEKYGIRNIYLSHFQDKNSTVDTITNILVEVTDAIKREIKVENTSQDQSTEELGIANHSASKEVDVIESMETEIKDLCQKYGTVEKPLIYRNKDKPLRYYAVCESCKKLVFSISKAEIKRHFVKHFQSEILDCSEEKEYCKECNKTFPNSPNSFALHLGITHNMLEKFIKKEGCGIQSIPIIKKCTNKTVKDGRNEIKQEDSFGPSLSETNFEDDDLNSDINEANKDSALSKESTSLKQVDDTFGIKKEEVHNDVKASFEIKESNILNFKIKVEAH